MTDRLRGTLEMTAAMVLSGTIGWFVVVSRQPVMDVVFWRCVFGAATLLVVCAAMGFLRRDILTARQFMLAVIGGVAIVANWLLLFAAYPRASISIATVVYNTQPLMLVGLGALFFAERLTATKLFWLGLAFAGMLLVVQARPEARLIGTDYLSGILMALGAAFFYAVAAIVAKKLKGVPPHLIALIQASVGAAGQSRPPAGGRGKLDRTDLDDPGRPRRSPYRPRLYPALRCHSKAADEPDGIALLHLSDRGDLC